MADLRVRIDDDVGKQPHVITQPAVVADVVSAQQGRAGTHGDTFTDHAMRADVR